MGPQTWRILATPDLLHPMVWQHPACSRIPLDRAPPDSAHGRPQAAWRCLVVIRAADKDSGARLSLYQGALLARLRQARKRLESVPQPGYCIRQLCTGQQGQQA